MIDLDLDLVDVLLLVLTMIVLYARQDIMPKMFNRPGSRKVNPQINKKRKRDDNSTVDDIDSDVESDENDEPSSENDEGYSLGSTSSGSKSDHRQDADDPDLVDNYVYQGPYQQDRWEEEADAEEDAEEKAILAYENIAIEQKQEQIDDLIRLYFNYEEDGTYKNYQQLRDVYFGSLDDNSAQKSPSSPYPFDARTVSRIESKAVQEEDLIETINEFLDICIKCASSKSVAYEASGSESRNPYARSYGRQGFESKRVYAADIFPKTLENVLMLFDVWQIASLEILKILTGDNTADDANEIATYLSNAMMGILDFYSQEEILKKRLGQLEKNHQFTDFHKNGFTGKAVATLINPQSPPVFWNLDQNSLWTVEEIYNNFANIVSSEVIKAIDQVVREKGINLGEAEESFRGVAQAFTLITYTWYNAPQNLQPHYRDHITKYVEMFKEIHFIRKEKENYDDTKTPKRQRKSALDAYVEEVKRYDLENNEIAPYAAALFRPTTKGGKQSRARNNIDKMFAIKISETIDENLGTDDEPGLTSFDLYHVNLADAKEFNMFVSGFLSIFNQYAHALNVSLLIDNFIVLKNKSQKDSDYDDFLKTPFEDDLKMLQHGIINLGKKVGNDAFYRWKKSGNFFPFEFFIPEHPLAYSLFSNSAMADPLTVREMKERLDEVLVYPATVDLFNEEERGYNILHIMKMFKNLAEFNAKGDLKTNRVFKNDMIKHVLGADRGFHEILANRKVNFEEAAETFTKKT